MIRLHDYWRSSAAYRVFPGTATSLGIASPPRALPSARRAVRCCGEQRSSWYVAPKRLPTVTGMDQASP